MNFEKSLPASAHKRLWAKVPPRKGGGGAESREGQEADEGRQAAQLPAETLLPGDSNVGTQPLTRMEIHNKLLSLVTAARLWKSRSMMQEFVKLTKTPMLWGRKTIEKELALTFNKHFTFTIDFFMKMQR